jgi:hypothetical protein
MEAFKGSLTIKLPAIAGDIDTLSTGAIGSTSTAATWPFRVPGLLERIRHKLRLLKARQGRFTYSVSTGAINSTSTVVFWPF